VTVGPILAQEDRAMALKVVMFSDYICPFCYVGFETMRRLKPEFDFQLEWRGFQIHPDWPAEGIPADKLREAGDAAARKATWERITAMADAVGFSMKPPAVLTNSRAALAATEFARESGRDEALEERIYRAYFNDGENIGDASVVTRLAREAGIDASEVAGAIKSPKYEMRLKNNSLAANQRGVSGVPTFFIGEYPLVGAQNLDAMRAILKRATERFAS
ncbi:DsbA family oxidoreductase, partial [Candidatus Binatus sp.]|uniref:DsbA family oxidoreductase n=2 Tax=Candidatus Binatus sp. TaxID=2811406 RepID=UPI003BB03AAE